MVEAAASVEWIVTDGEVAALMMEYNLIKEHRPRFNIRLRDDKSYPYLAITRGEEWPRATVMRGRRRRDTQYFGPYANAYAIRQTLDLLLRTFPVRTCTNSQVPAPAGARGGPACSSTSSAAPARASGRWPPEDYAAHLDGLAAFLGGDSEAVLARLRADMEAASEALEYERAARLRDQAAAVEKALARQEVATLRKEDFDLLAVEEDDLEAALVVLTVRRGRVTGRLATVVDKVEEVATPELVGRLLGEVYGEDRPPPGGPGAGAAGRSRGVAGVAGRAARGEGGSAGAPARGQAAPAGHRRRPTPPRCSPGTGCSATATTTPGPGPCAACRTPWACRSRRCASSATTSRRSRGATPSAPWW